MVLGSLNCAAYMGGIIEAILCGGGFVSITSRPSLKTNDGYIAASIKIKQNLSACHHLSNCFDIISGDLQIQ